MNNENSHVVLKINGWEVPMNEFVSRVCSNLVNGFVDSLDKIPEDKKKIEITIEKK